MVYTNEDFEMTLWTKQDETILTDLQKRKIEFEKEQRRNAQASFLRSLASMIDSGAEIRFDFGHGLIVDSQDSIRITDDYGQNNLVKLLREDGLFS
jgi:hypothetical protein